MKTVTILILYVLVTTKICRDVVALLGVSFIILASISLVSLRNFLYEVLIHEFTVSKSFNEKEEKFVNDVSDEAVEQYEETAIDNDMLNNNNDSISRWEN